MTPRRGLTWVTRAAQFRDPDTGRWITRVQVRSWIDKFIAASQAKLLEASSAYRAGNLSLDEWQATMREEIKDAHLTAEALARGGWNQLTPADFGRVGQRVRAQYRFLAGFTEDLRRGAVRLDGAFLNRAKSYAGSALAGFYGSMGDVAASAGLTRERSMLSVAEHCQGCIDEAAKGWVPIGTLTPIGQRPCLGNDKCHMAYA